MNKKTDQLFNELLLDYKKQLNSLSEVINFLGESKEDFYNQRFYKIEGLSHEVLEDKLHDLRKWIESQQVEADLIADSMPCTYESELKERISDYNLSII